ncbi:MAG: HpcH/HpaI aldolase family protein, partial [Verrucomicrobiales bacterium]
FVFIDTEHIAIGRESLSWMCRTYAAMGLPPLVRVPSPDPYAATVALDDGAAGVVAPYIERVGEVRALVEATKFRPLKGEKAAQCVSGESALGEELGAYIEKGTAGNTLVVNIESTPAIENLDQILALKEIDGVLIGPHDLSCSLGIPEQYGDARFLKAVETILTKARAAGIGGGIHFWGTIDEQVRLIEMGANLFIHKADAIFLREGLIRDLGEIRSRCGVSDTPAKDGAINI